MISAQEQGNGAEMARRKREAELALKLLRLGSEELSVEELSRALTRTMTGNYTPSARTILEDVYILAGSEKSRGFLK